MGEGIQAFQIEAEALCKSFVQGYVGGEWRVVSRAGMVVCEYRITNLSLFSWGLLGFSTPPPTKQIGTLFTLCEIWFPVCSVPAGNKRQAKKRRIYDKGTFPLDCFSCEMISSINESSPYPQTENVRRLKAFWKECLFERK